MTMGFSSVNCQSGNAAIFGGAVGTFIPIPIFGNFGPILGGALTGYATEIYCQNRFVSPMERAALTAMGYGAMGGAAGITAQVAIGGLMFP